MWLTNAKYDFFLYCLDWLIAQLGGLDWLMLVLPFIMDEGSICICGWQYSFSSLHFLHLWFSFWCFFRPTQMFIPNLVYFGHLSWVDSLLFEVEKSYLIPIPWTVYLNLPYFLYDFSVNCRLLTISFCSYFFFKKKPLPLSISLIPLQSNILFSICLKLLDIFYCKF